MQLITYGDRGAKRIIVGNFENHFRQLKKDIKDCVKNKDFNTIDKYFFYENGKGGALPFLGVYCIDSEIYTHATHFIYVLIKDNYVVYIGCTNNRQRLGCYEHQKKDYDAKAVMPIFDGNGFEYETILINVFKPTLNKIIKKLPICQI